jgi:hypothetical protein
LPAPGAPNRINLIVVLYRFLGPKAVGFGRECQPRALGTGGCI